MILILLFIIAQTLFSGLLTQTSQTSHLTNGKTPDGTVHVSVAANETVDTSDSQTHHIMIIQEDSSSVDNPYTTAQIIANNVGQVCS